MAIVSTGEKTCAAIREKTIVDGATTATMDAGVQKWLFNQMAAEQVKLQMTKLWTRYKGNDK